MADDKKRSALENQTGETEAERTVHISRGRSVTVSQEGLDDVVEIRAASGAVELKVRITEEGPVLSLEGVRLQMKSAGDIDVECETFHVDAKKSVAIDSQGTLEMKSEEDLKVESTAEIRINGKMIWLN